MGNIAQLTRFKNRATLPQTMEFGKENSKEKLVKLIEAIDLYSLEMAGGSQEAAISLLNTMVSPGPDVPPRIKVAEIELAQALAVGGLNGQETLAIVMANSFLRRFNVAFGSGTSAGRVIGWQDSVLGWFFSNLGCTLQALLHPDGQYAQDGLRVEGHLALATQHYYRLLYLAEYRLTQPATQK